MKKICLMILILTAALLFACVPDSDNESPEIPSEPAEERDDFFKRVSVKEAEELFDGFRRDERCSRKTCRIFHFGIYLLKNRLPKATIREPVLFHPVYLKIFKTSCTTRQSMIFSSMTSPSTSVSPSSKTSILTFSARYSSV